VGTVPLMVSATRTAVVSATKNINGAFPAIHTMIGSQNSHGILPHLNKSPQTSPRLASRILITRPHLSYFLPRMVLNPSALSAPFTPTDSIPSGQQRRHLTAATLARQATVLIRQPWTQHSPATDPSFACHSAYQSRSMAAHSASYKVTRSKVVLSPWDT
jgi:hypothetical protein